MVIIHVFVDSGRAVGCSEDGRDGRWIGGMDRVGLGRLYIMQIVKKMEISCILEDKREWNLRWVAREVGGTGG